MEIPTTHQAPPPNNEHEHAQVPPPKNEHEHTHAPHEAEHEHAQVPPPNNEHEHAHAPHPNNEHEHTHAPHEPEHGWVRVTKIGEAVTEAELLQLFGFCGFVSGIKLSHDEDESPFKIAIIEFWDKTAVTTACLLSSAVLQGQPIQVELYIATTDEQHHLTQSDTKSAGPPPPSTGDIIAKQSKTAVIAQVVAKNYLLANDVKERAIAWDTNNLTILQKLEALGTLALNNAAAINEKYHLSEKKDEFIAAAGQKAIEIKAILDANPNVQFAKAKVSSFDMKYGISTKAQNLYEQAKTSATNLMDETRAEMARQQEQRQKQAVLEQAIYNPQ